MNEEIFKQYMDSDCCSEDIGKQAPCWDGYVQRGMKPGAGGKQVPNCVPVAKVDDYYEDKDDVEYEDDKTMFADFGKDFTRSTGMPNLFKSMGVGSMVSWNSSGGRAEGKITRIITNGTYKVPGTSVSVSGTKEDPAAVIRLYRDGKPTDITVAHKVKSLRSK